MAAKRARGGFDSQYRKLRGANKGNRRNQHRPPTVEAIEPRLLLSAANQLALTYTSVGVSARSITLNAALENSGAVVTADASTVAFYVNGPGLS